jgi:hypothetical protein
MAFLSRNQQWLPRYSSSRIRVAETREGLKSLHSSTHSASKAQVTASVDCILPYCSSQEPKGIIPDQRVATQCFLRSPGFFISPYVKLSEKNKDDILSCNEGDYIIPQPRQDNSEGEKEALLLSVLRQYLQAPTACCSKQTFSSCPVHIGS